MKNIKVRQYTIPLWLIAIWLIFGITCIFFSGLWKVEGRDIPYLLGNLDSPISIRIFVWGKPAEVHTLGGHVFHVQLATEEQVSVLSKVPHTSFYASRFSPSVSMEINRRHLVFVTSLSFVKHVRIIPPITLF